MKVKLLKTWKNSLFFPEKIGENIFTFKQMLSVSFLLGFIYNTGHYFSYNYEETIVSFDKLILSLEFWIHSLFGGFSALSMFIVAPVVGYYGIKFLGKEIGFKKIEQAVFASMFVWLLPWLISLISFEAISLTPYFKMASSMIITIVVASIMTFFIFRKFFKLSLLKSLIPAFLVSVIFYFLPKFIWGYITWEIAHITHRMPLDVKCLYGILFFGLIAIICYFIRIKKI